MVVCFLLLDFLLTVIVAVTLLLLSFACIIPVKYYATKNTMLLNLN